MPYQPGQSGNPGGRPKGMSPVRVLAREHTEAAIAKLVEIMQKGESEQAQLGAANALLDRGWGKPTQVIAGEDDGPIEVALTDVRERIAQRLLKMREAEKPADDGEKDCSAI